MELSVVRGMADFQYLHIGSTGAKIQHYSKKNAIKNAKGISNQRLPYMLDENKILYFLDKKYSIFMKQWEGQN